MSRRKKNAVMKFVVPTAIALGKHAIGHWPILVAAVGGAVVHRLWSSRRKRSLAGTSLNAWADDLTTPATSSRPSGTTRTGSSSTPATDAWMPTTTRSF